MKVIIVEDDLRDLNVIQQFLCDYEKSRNIHFKIDIKNDWEFIIDNINYYDLAFIDIEISISQNGIELACLMRKMNRNIHIVFMSNFSDYLIDGYRARADLYLLKPIDQNYLNIGLDDILKDYFTYDLSFCDKRLRPTKIYFNEIVYVEMLARKVHFHLKDGQILSCFDTLVSWYDKLNEGYFVQIHRAFIVNMEFVENYRINEIKLKTGEILKITEIYKNNFKNKYIQYLNVKRYRI